MCEHNCRHETELQESTVKLDLTWLYMVVMVLTITGVLAFAIKGLN